uniref:Uncharacterized protein n=1 Tax=Rhizophora mucronata TaxID=61149 RepID=A0A2P2PC03_RHIMU
MHFLFSINIPVQAIKKHGCTYPHIALSIVR